MFSVTESKQMNQFMPSQDYVYVEDKQDTEQEQEQEVDSQEKDEAFRESTQTSRLPRMAKDNLERAREMTENGYEKLYNIKMKEFEAEEELIRAGTHPDYHRKLASLLERKERNLNRAQDRFDKEVDNIKKVLAADVKAAHDTLLTARRNLRNQYLVSLTKDRFNLRKDFKNPYEKSTVSSASPIVLQKRRKTMMEESEEGLADETDIPSWAVQLIKKRRRAGYEQLWTPPICDGLDENEMEQDMEFLKTISQIKS